MRYHESQDHSVTALLATPRVAAWMFAVLSGALVIGSFAGSGASSSARTAHVREATRAPTVATSPPPTIPSSTTTTRPDPNADRTVKQPPNATLPPLPAGGLGPGSTGDVVKAYEQRMVDVKLDPGPVDGTYDQDTQYAVDTLQRIMGGPVGGPIGLAEAAYLEKFHYLDPLHGDAEADRTEIDVTKQLLTLYKNYQVRLVTMTSTGTGASYCVDTPKVNPTHRVCSTADTPSGRFTYYYRYDGLQDGDLGTLYNPVYFNAGIAVHGADHVSLAPQSYGCANIPMHIAEYFPKLVQNGDVVYVDGGNPVTFISDTPIDAPTTTAAPPPAPSDTAAPDTTTPETTTVPPDTTTSLPPETTTTTEPPTTTTAPPPTTTSTPVTP